MPILSFGHSNKQLADMLDILKRSEVSLLVDVRSRPASRYTPQFNKASLAAELPMAGIDYLWYGKHLGGLGVNTLYDEHILELAYASQNRVIAVMCSEGSPDKCHRRFMLTPSFQEQGADVYDLLWSGQIRPAPVLAPKGGGDTPVQDALF